VGRSFCSLKLCSAYGRVCSYRRRAGGIGLRLAARVPFWFPVGVGEPADGIDHGGDGVGHVGEVDGADLVARLVIVLVQAVAGDGLSDDSLLSQCVVVGTAEEVLFGMRVVDQVGTVFRQFGAKVRAVEAGEPEGSCGDCRVGSADHLELEVGDYAGEGDWRVREEGSVAEAAKFFRAEECEDDGASGAWAGGEDVGQGQYGSGAGCVVVGSVVVHVTGCVGGADAEMIEVRGEEDDLFGRGGSAQDGDCVPGLFSWDVLEFCDALLRSCGKRVGEGGLLEEGAVVSSGLKAEGLELRGDEEGRNMLVACG